jgi:hypothetical protein
MTRMHSIYITGQDIRSLADEAGRAGDMAMVRIAHRALDGHRASQRECYRVISQNRQECEE